MNALELADELWFLPSTDRDLIEDAVNMLRTLHAELDKLITEREQNAQNIDQMSKKLPIGNEPVAWMMVNRENTSKYLTFDKPTRDMKISHEPHELYTHPPLRELTIQEVGLLTTDPRFSHIESPLLLEFYQACLKKAQSECNGFCGEYECKENQSNCKRKAQEK